MPEIVQSAILWKLILHSCASQLSCSLQVERIATQVKTGSVASTHQDRSADAQTSSPRDKELRGQRSAPDQIRNLARELRVCRSAPDLTIPALAAIRGLQDGSLQVDRQTRIKIAAVAKRVLEGRELKRRASQERDALNRLHEAPAVLVSPPGETLLHIKFF